METAPNIDVFRGEEGLLKRKMSSQFGGHEAGADLVTLVRGQVCWSFECGGGLLLLLLLLLLDDEERSSCCGAEGEKDDGERDGDGDVAAARGVGARVQVVRWGVRGKRWSGRRQGR